MYIYIYILKTHQLTNLGVIHFTERVFFLTLCTCKPTNSKSCHSITLSVSLLHCFLPETSFVLDL